MNRLQKMFVTGALILAPVLSVSAASAAPATVALNQDTVKTFAQQYGVDLSSLLQGNLNLSNSNVYWGGMIFKYPFQFQNGYGSGNAGHSNGDTNSGSGQDTTFPSYPDSGNTSDSTGGGTTSGTPAANTGDNGSGTNGGSSQDTAGTGTASNSSYASQVVDLVNQERTKAGLKPLTSDSALTNVALAKAKDMYTNNYFDHTSPTYGSPFDMMKSFGISYTYAGENIAKGQRDPQEVMTAWMNSEGHRQNIMSPNYTKIGVAYYNGEWVQEFIAN